MSAETTRHWGGHLTEGPDQIADASAGSGLSGRLVLLEPGQSASV
jgi:hypothetical protein